MRPHPSQALAQPRQFGRYELLSPLGKGGMAEVFLARARGPKGFERVLVIKRILPHLCADEEFVEMFVSEAKVSSILSHGNIVQVYEFGEADGQLFLAIERVEGTDLRSLLKRLAKQGKRIDPIAAVHVAVRVLDALSYAHTRTDADGHQLGIVHRDVSPSNILVSRAGEVKLCDFGIAKIATQHTATGRLKGKMAYMSPEQISGVPLDSRSDLWSVGVVLWEMLSGRKLFLGDSDVDTISRVRSAPVPVLPRLGVAHEDRLREIVRSALERDPQRRYLDAATFADDLMTLSALLGGDPKAELRQLALDADGPVAAVEEPPIASAETAMLDRPDLATEAQADPVAASRQGHGDSSSIDRASRPTGSSLSESLVRPVARPLTAGIVVLVTAAIVAAATALVVVLWQDTGPAPREPLPGAPVVVPSAGLERPQRPPVLLAPPGAEQRSSEVPIDQAIPAPPQSPTQRDDTNRPPAPRPPAEARIAETEPSSPGRDRPQRAQAQPTAPPPARSRPRVDRERTLDPF